MHKIVLVRCLDSTSGKAFATSLQAKHYRVEELKLFSISASEKNLDKLMIPEVDMLTELKLFAMIRPLLNRIQTWVNTGSSQGYVVISIANIDDRFINNEEQL